MIFILMKLCRMVENDRIETWKVESPEELKYIFFVSKDKPFIVEEKKMSKFEKRICSKQAIFFFILNIKQFYFLEKYMRLNTLHARHFHFNSKKGMSSSSSVYEL